MTRYFNDDRTRMIDDAPPLVAAAAYKVEHIGDSYEAGHVGVFESGDDAISWLRFGEPQPIRITVRRESA